MLQPLPQVEQDGRRRAPDALAGPRVLEHHAAAPAIVDLDAAQVVGAELARRYWALLAALGLDHEDGGGLLPPYNLVATRRWMLLTPRARAEIDGIPVNALGFAGSLLARTPAQLEYLRTVGPLTVLESVGA